VEFKREFPEQAHAIAREMVALANSGGGVLLMGVENDGTPKGISDPEKVEERLSSITRGCTPSIHAAIVKFHLSKNIFLVYAKISSATSLTLYQGKAYTRIGSATHEATGEEVTRIVLRMQKPSARSKTRPTQRRLKSVAAKARDLPRIRIMFQRGISSQAIV
jgi:ATP-dependent DNA helicase RecG